MTHIKHDPALVYDAFGQELAHGHHTEALQKIIGQDLAILVDEYHKSLDAAKEVENDPEHENHAKAEAAKARVDEATHGRFKGLWSIARYDDPIEYYAYRILNNLKYGHKVTAEDIDSIDFHKLPAVIREQADRAMKRNNPRPNRTEFEEVFENLFTTQGVSTLWHQAASDGAANSGGSVPAVKAWFNNAQAVLGVGDSATAATNAQYDLQAVTNRLWVAMDSSYPTLPGTGSNAIVFRATFGSSQANYSWNEFAIANDGGSNVSIPGSTARSSSNGTMLDRVVSAQGAKASGQTWQPTMTLSIS
jgi:hypothetical protein